MPSNNQIRFGVGFDVDKAGIDSLRNQLKQLQNITEKQLSPNIRSADAVTELNKIISVANQVDKALENAFNVNLGTLNIAKFSQELNNIGIDRIATQFSKAGVAGEQAFNNIMTQALTANNQLKQTYTTLDKIRTTLSNTVKWNLASSAVNGISNSIRDAFNYTKALDTSLTNIRIVTGDSRDEMAQFAVEANKAAQALGRQTKDYTNAALSFYQQGLGDEEVKARTEATLMAQNVTGAGAEMADYLTAVWNGFQINTENTVSAVDKLAAVADSSASNLSELAVAMSKSSSIANTMGVDIDQLAAQISTIIATTRQAPETVGNALKTIYARINDIKTGSDDAEVSLGNYTGKMAALGFSVLDAEGNLRDTGEVIEEIGNSWSSLSREQQIYLAQTMAGQRQLNNLIALFDNWDQYIDMVNVSMNSQGSLMEKNGRYMESWTAHAKQFSAAMEGLQDTLINEEDMKGFLDAGTAAINLLNHFIQSIGGTHTVLVGLGTLLGSLFTNQMADGITKFIFNFNLVSEKARQVQAELQLLEQFKGTQIQSNIKDQLLAWKEKIIEYRDVISEEQNVALNNDMKEYNDIQAKVQNWEQAREKAVEYYEAVGGSREDFENVTTSSSQSDIDAAVSLVTDQTKEALSDYEEIAKSVKNFDNEMHSAINSQKKFNYNAEASEKDLKQQIATWEAINDKIDETYNSALKLSEDPNLFQLIPPEQQQAIEDALRKIEELESKGQFNLETDQESQQAAQELANAYSQAYSTIENRANQAAEHMRQTAQGTGEQLAGAAQETSQRIQRAIDQLEFKKAIKGGLEFVSALGGIATALMSISRIGKIFDDDSLTSGEKFLQIITAITFALPLLTSNIKKAIDGFVTFKSVISLGGVGGLSGVQTGLTFIGQQLFGVSAGAEAATVTVGQLTAALGVIAGIAVVAGAAIYGLYKYINRYKDAAEEANKKAEESRKHYQELNDEYKELKKSLEDYQTAYDALSKMDDKTKEWAESVKNLHTNYLALAQDLTPEELGKIFTTDSNGNQAINTEGLQEVLQGREKNAITADYQSYRADMAANEANNTSNVHDLNIRYFDPTRGKEGQNRTISDSDIQAAVDAYRENSNIFKSGVDNIKEVTGINNDLVVKALIQNSDRIAELAGKIGNTDTQAGDLAYAERFLSNQMGDEQWSSISQEQRSAMTRSLAERLGSAETEGARQEVIDNGVQEVIDSVSKVQDKIALEFMSNEMPDLAKFTKSEIEKALQDKTNQWTSEQSQALQTQLDKLNTPFEGSKYNRVNTAVQRFTTRQGEENISTSDQEFLQGTLEKALSESTDTFNDVFAIFNKNGLEGSKFVGALRDLSGQTEVTRGDIEKIVRDFNLTESAVEPLLKIFGTGLPQDFESLSQRYQDIESATKGIKDGDVVSAKDIEAMKALGLDTERFFAIGADGAGHLRTSAEEFYEYVNNQSLEGFKEQIESLKEEVSNREHLTDKFDSAQDIVDTGTSTEKLDYLDYSGYDASFIEDARAEFADTGRLSAETINQINEAILNLGDEGLNKLAEGTAEVVEEANKLQNAVSLTESDSIDEVNESYMAGDLSKEDYGAALETASTKEFKGLDLDPDEVKEYADAIQEAADDSDDLADSLETDRAEALKLAREYARLNRGIEDLAKNYDDWIEALDSGDTLEQADAARELKEAIADIADIDASQISEDFLQNAENLELMKGAADGDIESINALRSAVAEDILVHAAVDSGADAQVQADLLAMHSNAQAMLEANRLEVGANLDNAQILGALTEIVNAAGMTAQQASAYLASMGVDAEVTEVPNKGKTTYTYPTINVEPDEYGLPHITKGEPITVEGSYEGNLGSALKIENAKWGETSGGNIKSSNKGGYSGGGKKGKGGGGGGGGGKAPKKQKAEDPIDKRDNEPDLYHDINIEIRDLNHEMVKLSNNEEKLVGKGLVTNLRDQATMLRKQKDLLAEKAKIQEKDLAQQKEELTALGVTFDTYGNITNYMDIMVKYQEELNRLADVYNDIVAKFNAASPEEQEALKEQLDAAKEEYELAKKKRDQQEEYIKKYDDTMADWQQNQEEMLDKENEAIEKLIEAFNKEIDVRLDVKQAELDFNEFRRKVIDQIKEDDYLGLATANIGKFDSYYRDTDDGIIQKLTDHVNEIMDEAEEIYGGGYSEIYGDNMAAAMEDLKNYNDELMSSLEEVEDLVEEIHDNYLDMIDKAQEEFDTQKDIYDQIDETIEHDLSLLELLQGEDNYADRNQYLDKQVQNYYDQMDLLRREKEMWWSLMEGAERGTEEWKKFRDNWLQAVSDFNDAIEASVEKMFEKYQNMIQTIIKDARDQAFGGDMQQALNQWDDLLWNNDRYLDMPSRATGVLNFIDNANKAMNGLDAKAQKDINALMDSEVERLNNIKNLRQIDLDIANKRLEVLQKQIALEDAQNNKTKMRLRRDSQGNYTYQYVADEDNIAERQSELNQALEELRQLSKNDLTETVSEMSERLQEYFDQAQELNDTYYYDQELLNEKLAELHDRYFNPETGIMSKMDLDYQTMQGVLFQDTGAQFAELLRQQGDDLAAFLGLDTANAAENSVWQAVQKMIAPDGEIPTLLKSFTTNTYEKNLDKMSEDMRNMLFEKSGIQPSWNSAVGNMAADFSDHLLPTIEDSMDKMIDANQEYMDDLDELQDVAGVSFENVADGIDMDIAYTQDLLEENDNLVNSYWDQVEATGAAYDSIKDLCDAYSDAAEAARDAAEAAYEYWRAVNLDFEDEDLDDEFEDSGNYHWEDIGDKSLAATDNNYYKWIAVDEKGNRAKNKTIKMNVSAADDSLGTGMFKMDEEGILVADAVHNQHTGTYGLISGTGTLSDEELLRRTRGYAEGGYTGDWQAGYGKLALVHPGEYVLTKDDVPTLFNAVAIANDVLNKVASFSGALLDTVISNRGELGGRSGDVLDQNVTIYAEFKDATSAEQIRVAFRDLINEASQRVSQNRRVQ